MKKLMSRYRALRHADRGTAMLELALGLPIVLALGGYGAELSNYAIISQRVNQAALQLADNASRVGSNDNNLTVFQLREVDMNDVLQGLRLASANINLTGHGRITVSSLEYVQQKYDNAPVQRIHWQRCIGVRGGIADPNYDSTYGTAKSTDGSTANQADAGTLTPNGMGDTGAKVSAPTGYGLIFVEVNYEYQPVFGKVMFGEAFMQPTRIHYTASFIVRDNRDFTQIYPSANTVASTCDKHNA